MKPDNSMSKKSPHYSAAILVLGIVLAGCGQRGPASAATGRANETWGYWESFNRAAATDEGIEVFQTASMPAGLGEDDVVLALQDIAQAERARCRQVEGLPLLNVDSNLVSYASGFVTVHARIASVLNEF